MLHFGFTPDEVALRLDHRTEFSGAGGEPYLPDGLPVAHLLPVDEGLALDAEVVARIRSSYASLPERSRYVLTVRLGLGVERQTLRAAAEPLGLHLNRVRQLQLLAVDALADAAAGEGRRRPDPASLRNDVTETLRKLAAPA